MHPSISSGIQSLESKRNELSELLLLYPEAVLLNKPSPEVWSPLEVVHHLYISEHYSRLYLQKKMQGVNQLKTAGLLSQIRLWALLVSLKTPFKFKAPDRIAKHPPDLGVSILEKWKQERILLAEFMESIDDSLLRLELFRHPFAGRMSVLQMLQFFEAHFDRHALQIMDRLPTNQGT